MRPRWSPASRARCRKSPEERAGEGDEAGGPEPPKDGDGDRDGTPDSRDKCPDDPEDKDGFEDQDGCPELDNDNDGIPDVKDLCPNEPETWRAAHQFLLYEDFFLRRLGGEALISGCLASRTQMKDLASGAWAPDLLERCGIEPGRLARLTAPADGPTGS